MPTYVRDIHWTCPADDSYPPDHTVLPPCRIEYEWTCEIKPDTFVIRLCTEETLLPRWVVAMTCADHNEVLRLIDYHHEDGADFKTRTKHLVAGHQQKELSEKYADIIAWEEGKL